MTKIRLAVIQAHINQIEKSLALLKKQVQQLSEEDGREEHTFADLEGILEGLVSTSEEEIDAALYRMTPEMEDEIATVPRAPGTEDAANTLSANQ